MARIRRIPLARLGLDRLEERLAPSVDLVLGRVASADTTTNLTGSTIDVTYTIYNQREVPLTAASIETTLASGVSITQSSSTSSATTGLVSWSVGNIPAFGRASVTATLSLPTMTTTAIDSGSRAMATIDAGRSSDTAPAIVLLDRPIPAEYLAATPDADRRDVVVQEQAARLDYDPTKIIDYLRSEIGYHAYSGSLRGARGTIWTNAANALDEASLGVALMRASGIPARYASGTLNDAQAGMLIESMFNVPTQIIGYLPANATVADPARNAELLAIARQHDWLQIDTGTGFVNVDMTGLSLVASPTQTFSSVPADRRQTVRISLEAESFDQAANAFQTSRGLTSQVVLDRTFNAVELVGRPVSVGQFVEDCPQGGLAFSSRGLTYTPYLRLGDITDPQAVTDQILTGTAFQELLTNFPLASRILTGLKLSMDLGGAGVNEHHERMLVDRLGFANRQSGQTANFSVDANAGPARSSADATTISFVSGFTDRRSPNGLRSRVTEQASDLATFAGQPIGTLPADYGQRLVQHTTDATRLVGHVVNQQEDELTRQFSRFMRVAAIDDRPRIIIAETILNTAENRVGMTIDLRRDTMKVIAAPGQNRDAELSFAISRGIIATEIERATLAQVTPTQLRPAILNTHTIFELARDQGVPVITLFPTDRPAVRQILTGSDDAMARIEAALSRGELVVVPQRAVGPTGLPPRLAWYEFHPETGATRSVGETGDHVTSIEYVFNTITFGIVAGVSASGFNAVSGGALKSFIDTCLNLETLFGAIQMILAGPPSAAASLQFALGAIGIPASAGFFPAFGASFKAMNWILGQDPPAEGIYLDRSGVRATAVPDTSNGFGVAVIRDPILTVPYLGDELPTAYQLDVINPSNATADVTLTVTNITSGWEVILSQSTWTLSANERGQTGLYFRPTSGVTPSVNDPIVFTIRLTSLANPSLNRVIPMNVSIPTSSTVRLLTHPYRATTWSGASQTMSLRIDNSGNVPLILSPQVMNLPAGVTVSGLPSTVSIPPSESVNVTYELTIAAGVAAETYFAWSFFVKNGNGDVRADAPILVRVTIPGVASISPAAVIANQQGDLILSERLGELTTALTTLAANPNDTVARSQSLAALDAVIRLFNADPETASFGSQLGPVRDAIAAASTANELLAAMANLEPIFNDYVALMQDRVEHGFSVSLATNVIVIQPGSPARIPIVLENTGTQTTTYDLTFAGGLPYGVNGSFTSNTVTLAPGERLNGGPSGLFVELTSTGSSMFPGSFAIQVTPQEATTLAKRLTGAVEVRPEVIQLASVALSEPFALPGDSVGITARILNAVNIQRPVRISYLVSNSSGTVISTSSTASAVLGLSTSLIDISLAPFVIPAGITGDLTIDVRVTESDGTPLAYRSATLIVGLPVSASIISDPQIDFVGTRTITSTLTLTGREQFTNPATLLGQVQTPPTATSVLVRGSIAYIAGTNGVSIVDVTNPHAPVLVGSFASNLIQSGNFTLIRELTGDRIVIASRGFLNADSFTLFTFSVANPTSPALLGQSTINEQFLTDMIVVGDRAVISTNGITFFGANLIGQFGDVVSLDLSNPSAVTVINELFGDAADDFNQNGIVLADTTTAYVASTTSTGSASQTGQGIVRVIDLSNPASLHAVREVTVPHTIQAQQVAVEGNRLMVLGSTGGWKSPFLGVADAQLTGRMTLSIFDITDRRNPILIGDTIVTDSFNRPVETADGGAMLSLTALGGGRFVASRGFIDGQPVVMLIDTTGDRIAVAAIPAPALVNETTYVNSRLYTTSGAGLSIYDIGTIAATTATARIRVPNDPNNQMMANSWNVPPTRIETGVAEDTIVWERAFAFGNNSSTLTWQTQIVDLLSGQSRPITLGTNVEFAYAGTGGSFDLAGTNIVGQNSLVLQPTDVTTTPGTAVDLSVVVSNPTAQIVNFNLFTLGLPNGWATFDGFAQGFASLLPQSTQTITLRLRPPEGTVPQSMEFVVGSSSNATISGRAQSRITVAPVIANVNGEASGIELSIAAGTPTIGRTTSTRSSIRLTNTGSETDTWSLAATLPSGVSATFEAVSVTISPGQSRDIFVTLTGDTTVLTGNAAWTVSAMSTRSSDSATSSIRLVDVGSTIVPSATTITPGDPLTVVVTNTGSATETFSLFTAGPAGILANLATSTVTLAPGASQTVNITTQPITNGTPGNRELIIVARANSEPSVMSSTRISLAVVAVHGSEVTVDRSTATITTPGSANYLVTVSNQGNVESAFQISLGGTNGTAKFAVIGGITNFRIPAFGRAQFTVRGTSTTAGTSSATIFVQSGNGPIDTETVTLETGGVSPPPPPPPPPPVSTNRRPIAVGAGSGSAPIVRVLDAETGLLIRELVAYSPDFTGGVTVAMGDVTGDGIADIITGPGPGGGPHIRIFDGASGQSLTSFFAYDPAFRGGANVAAGLMHAGKAWSIVTGAGPGGGPHVRTWSFVNGQISMVDNLMAYDAKFRGGVTVATADLNADGLAEIITGPGPGGGPHLAAFNQSGQLLGSRMVFDPNFRGGLSVAGRNTGATWTLYTAPLTVGDGIVQALTSWNSSPSPLTSPSGEMISTRIAIAENQLFMARHHDLSLRRIDLNSSSELNAILPFSDSNMLGVYIG